MEPHPFAEPVTLTIDGVSATIASAEEAQEWLTTRWPEGARGPRHRDAVETCLKVIDGHRSAVDARDALLAAAEEAGFAVES